jgi:TolA-binding protein
MKAITLLKTNKSVSERAERFAEGIRKELEYDMILSLEKKLDSMDDKIFELEDFSLNTDLNKGMRRMTQEECKGRFKDIINLNYEKKLLQLELNAKREAFEALFSGDKHISEL